jgi:photosystem II stability/assembly factor-like uncharacterized protein
MIQSRPTLAALFLVLALAPVAAARSRAIGPRTYPWQTPTCSQITGLDWLRYVEKFEPVRVVGWKSRATNSYLIKVVASSMPNVMYAVTGDGTIHQSNDAGCSWRARVRVPEVLANKEEVGIVAKSIAPVYVWSGSRLVRLTFGTVETFALPENIIVLDANPQNSQHLRAVSRYGRTFESQDGGSTWNNVGNLGFTTVTDAKFSPANFDHIIVAAYPGTLISTDGGRSWTAIASKLQVHAVAYSPADANVVWADAWNPNTRLGGIHRSEDGGRTFTLVRSAGGERYARGALAAHPTDSTRVALAVNITLEVIGADGSRTEVFHDSVEEALWAPNGTLYYFVYVIVSR